MNINMLGDGTKKFRDKNTPELPNLTAYEDYNRIERHSVPDILSCYFLLPGCRLYTTTGRKWIYPTPLFFTYPVKAFFVENKPHFLCSFRPNFLAYNFTL